MAALVLAITAGSVMLPMLAAAERNDEAVRLKYAIELGQALLDEIAARPVQDSRVSDTTLGPSAAETSRKAYVNVDAFDGFSESSDKILRDYESAAVAGDAIQGFWRTSSVQYVNYAGQYAGDTNAFALITVNVYSGNRLMVTLTRLVTVEI